MSIIEWEANFMKVTNVVTFRNFWISTGRLSVLRSDRLRCVNFHLNFDANNCMRFYACVIFDAIISMNKQRIQSERALRSRGVDSWLESRLESHCDSWLDSSHGPLRLANRLGLDPLTRTSHVESRSSHLATGRSWSLRDRRNGIGPIWKFLRQVSWSSLRI